ncbi:DUF4114 domain-containing protein [Romeria aff. gracilis LEGE 07310]|uniref:DUF4114 domain-containing protein n=1 Tax=Vasconcelosia minhoensis LEGE 07310 TaxID=915328 RepID=A0A8J7ALN7_9CYAN|nr:DUF4114 domain-containing protein [Romeria aff. gracilis LEGE 07310]
MTVYQSGEYLLLGFEDKAQDDKSDWDYNDVVFAVKGLMHRPFSLSKSVSGLIS